MLDLDGYWSETFTGKKYYPTNPEISKIDIIDITHALSQNCRYNGHCEKFYSIASHSIIVSKLIRQYTDDKHTILAALLHDASEAYIHDIITPLKIQMTEYKELELQWEAEIHKQFFIGNYDKNLVKECDVAALRFEAANLMPSRGVGWNIPETREFDFSGLQQYLYFGTNAKPYFLDEFSHIVCDW